jgi:cytidylate kinase
MIISFGGAAGSGKSTVAKKVAKKLNWPHYYMGALRRKKAKKLGLTLAEYNKLGESDPATDFEVDEYQKELAEKKDNFVIEGRTSWYFIPRAIKIYLDVKEREGAKRIFNDLKKSPGRNEGKKLKTTAAVLKSIRLRKKSDVYRYFKYYKIKINKKSNYDLFLDTTYLNKNEVFGLVWNFIRKRLNK